MELIDMELPIVFVNYTSSEYPLWNLPGVKKVNRCISRGVLFD